MTSTSNRRKRITLRESLLLNVLAIGAVCIIALIINSRISLNAALESQQSATIEIIHNDTNNAINTLRRLSRELGYNLQKEKLFHAGVDKNLKDDIVQAMDNQFSQYYTTANILKLEKIYFLDFEYELLGMTTRGYSVDKADPVICSSLIINSKLLKGFDRLKTRSGLCSYANRSFYGLLMPVGLTPHGYVLVITDPTFSVRELQGSIADPIKITQSNGEIVFATNDWPTNDEIKNFQVISHFHHFDNPLVEDDITYHGDVAFEVSVARNTARFSQQVNNALYVSTMLAIAMLLMAVLFAISIQNRSLRPLLKLRQAADSMSRDQYDLVHEKSFPEIDDVTNAYNSMTKKMQLLIADLEHARKEAEGANELKSRFLANMSHEIRTPLTSILGFAESLRNDELSKAQQTHHIETILRSGEHLKQIINDILDMSKIEAEKLEVEHIDVDVMKLLVDIRELVGKTASAKNLEFNINLETPIPAIIQSDVVRIKQILLNLLGNAVKFTERGRIELAVGYDQKNEIISFRVHDTGIGMTANEMKKLFIPFQQANISTTRKFGGTGLGLSLSKQLATLLGGDLTATSQKDVGSVFNLTVKTNATGSQFFREFGNEHPSQELSQNAKTTHEIKGTVLLAEDTPELQDLTRLYLTKAGLNVDIVNNGKEAVQAAKQKAYDLILMDMQMPIMDGLEAITILRREKYQGPIIALTANAMRGDKEKYINAGCNDYLAKPIDRQRLLGCITRFVNAKNQSDSAFSNLTDDDPEISAMIERFIASLTETSEKLLDNAKQNDWVKVSQLAHNLKGLGGSYGYPKLTEIAKDVEQASKTKSENLQASLDALITYMQRIVDNANNNQKNV